jgi:hypothetical protein
MVFKLSDDGKTGWHEPPFTWKEEQELYRRMSPRGADDYLPRSP